MACDTFIKIAKQCRKQFVLQQVGEVRPFIDEILEFKKRTTEDLQPQQVHTFYEALGYIIAAQTNVKFQEPLLAKAMDSANLQVCILKRLLYIIVSGITLFVKQVKIRHR